MLSFGLGDPRTNLKSYEDALKVLGQSYQAEDDAWLIAELFGVTPEQVMADLKAMKAP